jgi:HECT-domain (ubiquitin-transferase)
MPPSMLRSATLFNLQFVIEGDGTVTVEKLRRITKYSCCTEDQEEVKMFWRVLETFDNRQMKLYLKYVNGRTSLSASMSNYHKITYYGERNGIPETHTCFFELDLGKYCSDEELRRKLLYGMENCNVIAENHGQFMFDQEDID